jgi:alanyl-tRNA synthetase
MTAKKLKEKYLDFFKRKGHTVIPSASLIPEHDPSVLFTTAGMHPLVPYLLGQGHPAGKRLVNVQKSFRTDDIDEVGDSWHNTFFEMLGNWSLGDYWKKEAISWSFEFLTKELGLDKNRIYVTGFGGDSEIPGVGADEETVEIWKSLGIPEKRIHRLGKKDNWWGPVGQTGPCGPDTEMFYDTGVPEHGNECRPGETCGKYAEIWNDVFMEFNKTADGKYEPLKQKNVDTGMGVERTTAILQGKDNAYDTELFTSIMAEIKRLAKNWDVRSARIVADHLRAAAFLISDGVLPSNVERGYVVRRLIRRAIRFARLLGIEKDFTADVASVVVEIYKEDWPELAKNRDKVFSDLQGEETKFKKTLTEGIKQFEKLGPAISGKEAFSLYQSYGFPLELTIELAKEQGRKVDTEGFNKGFERHQEVSRSGAGQRFAGGLVDHSEKTIRGHTATHLLHQALREVLGDHAQQTGSNITPERIRFDFSHPERLTVEQIKRVEDTVNQKIKEDLPVKREMMSLDEAKKAGAIGLFGEKYADKVSVYSVGDPSAGSGQVFSKEICGGPHVEHTGQIGKFRIIKEEALGAGQRRIRAVSE